MKKTAILSALFCITLTACDLDSWNLINRTAFIEACVEEAGEPAREFCECGLKEVMKDYTPSEADNLPEEAYEEIAQACIETLMGINTEE
jgi:hypothetical protein